MNSEFTHPEIGPGEVFFSNSDARQFELMEFKSKRRGRQAFDGEGNRIAPKDWLPVFLQRSELSRLGVSLEAARKLFREQL
jgi:hypothetical protein